MTTSTTDAEAIREAFAKIVVEADRDWNGNVAGYRKYLVDRLTDCGLFVLASRREAQEPVAWRVTYADGETVYLRHKPSGDSGVYECAPLYTAPPADAGMREALERYTVDIVRNAMLTMWNDICADTDCHPLDIEHGRGKYLTFTPRHWAEASGKMVRRNLLDLTAPGATTKSDGGEERPASNPLSEVTHRPSDPKTSPELLALLERAKSHVMTPEDVYEQRRSFVRGMCPSDRDYTEWCADVDRIIPPLAGPSDTRPADVTVTPRVIDNDRDEIVVTLNGNELRGWSYSTEQERRVKMLCAREFVEGFHAGRQP